MPPIRIPPPTDMPPPAGRASTVVVPLAGFMLPHVWRPARSSPVTLMHDMTLRDGGERGAAAAAQQQQGGEGTLVATRDAALSVAASLAAHRRSIAAHWHAEGPPFPVPGPVSVSLLSPSPRVVYVGVPALDAKPWRPGHACVEDVFDA